MAGVITWCVLATALFALACCCESRTRGAASLTRDAVDHLPSGICLARRDGAPIHEDQHGWNGGVSDGGVKRRQATIDLPSR